MKRHWAYLKAVLRHKYYVFLACLRLRVPLHIALLHDYDKFTPAMWVSYANTFYNADGSKRPYERGKESVAFMRAWKHHQQINKHHWQYWLRVNKTSIQKTDMFMMDSGKLFRVVSRNSGGDTWYELRELLDTSDDYRVEVAPMPDVFIREMLADWIGAGMAYGNLDLKGWYERNKDNMKLHPRTRMYLQVEMANYLHKFPLKQD